MDEEKINKLRKMSESSDKEGWRDSAVNELLKTYDKQKKLINIMAEALLFYADPQTYFAIAFIPDPPNGEFMDDISECEDEYGEWTKPGKRAREAIEEVRKLLL